MELSRVASGVEEMFKFYEIIIEIIKITDNIDKTRHGDDMMKIFRYSLGCLIIWFLLQALWSSQVEAASPGRFLEYNGKTARARSEMPGAVHEAVKAANRLQGKPYVFGGGHGRLHDRGYDCSGAVSYVLHHAGLLRGPLTSRGFLNYGEPGPGRYITLFVSKGHVFMSICGLRFDTSDWGAGRGDGPKWRPKSRKFSGYVMRHPSGL